MILKRNVVIGLPIPEKIVLNTKFIHKKRYKNIIIGKPITPQTLTLLLYDLYKQKNLKPTLPQISQYRMAKKFINTVGEEKAVDLVLYAASICKNVWTFKNS